MNPIGNEHEESVAQYPPADINPDEFERFVVAEFRQTQPFVDDLRITLHDVITGVDGTYDFDATVRYSLGGLDFLVIVEAKLHRHPIKRDTVQVLHSKLGSVGAHKAVIVSTAPFQRGALEFAAVHGVALVKVTEGRFTYETRQGGPQKSLSRDDAYRFLGLPSFVSHWYGASRSSGYVEVVLLTGQPAHAAHHLLGVTSPETPAALNRPRSDETRDHGDQT